MAQWLEYHTHFSYVRLVICRYDVSVGGQPSGLCTDTRMSIKFVPFSEDVLTHTQNHTMSRIAVLTSEEADPGRVGGLLRTTLLANFRIFPASSSLTAVIIVNYWV